jgi:hypothetical protein
MAKPTLIAVIFGVFFLIGNQTHERYHYWTGKFFDADPEYGDEFARIFRLNTQFHNRESLSDREIRAIGMPGHILFLFLIFLAIWPKFPTSYVGFALVGTVAGGALISWNDDMAVRDPETWKKFNDWMESQNRTS